MEKIKASAPPSLEGIDRKIAYANKKYHSGWICGGVAIGFEGEKFSGSPKAKGKEKRRKKNPPKTKQNPKKSFREKKAWKETFS